MTVDHVNWQDPNSNSSQSTDFTPVEPGDQEPRECDNGGPTPRERLRRLFVYLPSDKRALARSILEDL